MKDNKQHPWRLCDKGEYLIAGCVRHYKPSKLHPAGKSCNVPNYCRAIAHLTSKNHKDELHSTEIIAMTDKYFHGLSDPTLISGMTGFSDKFDHEIIGWVQYWSDILKPEQPLDLNLVKVLIATESSFREDLDYNKEHPNPKDQKKDDPRGLMQITTGTFKYLGYESELSEHLIILSDHKELFVGTVNICAGVGWLFRKRQLAHLKRKVLWIDAVAKYKSVSLCEKVEDYAKDKDSIMGKFVKKYNLLTGDKNPW